MANATIFSGNTIKALKRALTLFDQATIYSNTQNPTSTATQGNIGDIYVRTGVPGLYQKTTTNGTDTNWVQIPSGDSNDLPETAFAGANNQVAAANVTSLSFSSTIVRSAKVLVSVYVNATGSLYEFFTLDIINKGTTFEMAQTSAGDISGWVFTITSAGQVQYTSTNSAGWISTTVKFRAQVLSV